MTLELLRQQKLQKFKANEWRNIILLFIIQYLGLERASYWSHVWAVPCNRVKECSNGLDEEHCEIPDLVLPTLLGGVLLLLGASLFLYLYVHVNDTVKTIEKTSNKVHKCISNRMYKVAILAEEKNHAEIKTIYEKEIEIHGSEAGAICCLKVKRFDSNLFSQTHHKY